MLKIEMNPILCAYIFAEYEINAYICASNDVII